MLNRVRCSAAAYNADMSSYTREYMDAVEHLPQGATLVLQRLTWEDYERDFDRAKRILVPNLSDWVHAGRVLYRLAAKYHHEKIGQGRLTNDALIAMSAGRLGIKVVTANQRDFSRLAEFRGFQWQVISL